MKIGILGAGRIGGNLGTLWAEAGHEIMLSSRNPDQLGDLVEKLGGQAQAGTLAAAAAFGEVLVLAYPYAAHQEVIGAYGDDLTGKIIIDATNPFGHGISAPQGGTSGEATAQWLPQSRVVRAFSHIYAAALMQEAHREGDLLAVAMAGDDAEAKQVVAQLISDAGFVAVDLGALAESGALDPYGILWTRQLDEHAMRALLADG